MRLTAKIAVGAVAICAVLIAAVLLLESISNSLDQKEVDAARDQFSNGITVGMSQAEAERLMVEWGFTWGYVTEREFDKYSLLKWDVRPVEGSTGAIVAGKVLPKRIRFPIAEANLQVVIYLAADGKVLSRGTKVVYTGL